MVLPTNTFPDEKNHRFFKLLKGKLDQQQSSCIGITGAGGAGKSTLAQNIVQCYQNDAQAIDLDDYLLSRQERGRLGLTGYHPAANNLSKARQDILNLLNGKSIIKPIYSHEDGTNYDTEELQPSPILILEGVTTLYPNLDDLCTFSIYLDAQEETQIKSRIQRDVNTRGYTLDEALELYRNLKPWYAKFIEPTKKKATIVAEVGPDYVINPQL